MARRMDLFQDRQDASTQESKIEADEMAMARAHTAWGVFNCVTYAHPYNNVALTIWLTNLQDALVSVPNR